MPDAKEAPLPNVTKAILEKVLVYVEKQFGTKEDMADGGKSKETLKEFDQEFLKVDQATIFELIMVRCMLGGFAMAQHHRVSGRTLTDIFFQAANFLDCQPLLDLTCEAIANMVKGTNLHMWFTGPVELMHMRISINALH